MDEDEIKTSLETYKLQVGQVDMALMASGTENNEELMKLKQDLEELIKLTEESLLSLKKSKLLSMLDGGSSNTTPRHDETKIKPSTSTPSDNSSSMDAEFAAFQAAIMDEPAESSSGLGNGQNSESTHGATNGAQNMNSDAKNLMTTSLKSDTFSAQTSEPLEAGLEESAELMEDIVGTKCRAPFTHEWGTFQYHNAMIVSIENMEDSEPKVRVLFCNPTHRSMVPCPFYLDGRCRFNDDDCRFSHGYLVDVDSLEDFKDPDFSKLLLDTDCLAKDSDGIWYKAKVVEVTGQGHTYQVMFEENDATATVDIANIIPIDSSPAESDSDHDDVDAGSIHDTDSDSEALPVMLWQPGTDAGKMGDWEIYTKGIGSKLMAKMGYITGQGLGKDGKGRAEPVPIQLLPSGKSLDKIMELKALAADQDLFDVMKREKRKRNKVNDSAAKSYQKQHSENKESVFDFINKKLGHKKGNVHDLVSHQPASKKSTKVQHICESELKNKSDRHINVQVLKTHEEIKSVEKEIERLKASLARHEGKEQIVATQIRKKLSSMESYLQKLQTSEQTLQSQKQSRSDKKKLTIF